MRTHKDRRPETPTQWMRAVLQTNYAYRQQNSGTTSVNTAGVHKRTIIARIHMVVSFMLTYQSNYRSKTATEA
jgi:hypothetical protein